MHNTDIENDIKKATDINRAFETIKKEISTNGGDSSIKVESEEYNVNDEDKCKNCNWKKQEIRVTDTKAFAIKKLIELFSHSEEGERAKGRTILLYFSLGFIAFIFVIELGIIVAQGLGKLKLENIIFLGTIGSITSAIIFTFRLISKYLYNNETDKILQTIEKLFDK